APSLRCRPHPPRVRLPALRHDLAADAGSRPRAGQGPGTGRDRPRDPPERGGRLRPPPADERGVGGPMTLEGRVAIVTGAGTIGPGVGVGKATSVVLAQQGARLVLVDIDEERVRATEELVVAEGAEAIVCIGSVSESSDCDALVARAVDTFGTIDILVNNAAASIPGTVVSLTEEDWATVLGVNLLGAVRMSRYVVPVMQAAGRGA